MVLPGSPMPLDLNLPIKAVSSHSTNSSTTSSINEFNTPPTSIERRNSLLNNRLHNVHSHNDSNSSNNNNNNGIPTTANTFNVDIVIAMYDFNLNHHNSSVSSSSANSYTSPLFRSTSISAQSSTSSNNNNNSSNTSSDKDTKLSFHKGDTIYVLTKTPSGWWDGIVLQYTNNSNSNSDFKVIRGWFPNTFTRSFRENVSCVFKMKNSVSSMATYGPGNEENEAMVISLPLPVTNKNITNSRRNSSTLFPNYSRQGSVHSLGKNSIGSNATSTTTTKRSSLILPNNTKFIDTTVTNDTASVDPKDKKRSITSSLRSDSKSGSRLIRTKNEKINILSLEEVEMIISSVHSPICSTWTPVPMIINNNDPTSDSKQLSDKLIYYNKELDIYCSEFPLVSVNDNKLGINDPVIPTPPISSSTIDKFANLNNNPPPKCFPSDDHLVDLRARNLSEGFIKKNNNNPNGNKMMNSESPPILNSGSNTAVNDTSKEELTPPVEESKSVDPTDGQSQQPTSFVRCAVMAKPDLFYYHPKDIKTWIELEDLTFHYIKLTHDMILKNDFFNFKKFMTILSNMIIFTQLSCRLISSQIQQAKCNKKIKSLLKKIINALSRIDLNSLVYFDNSGMNFSQVAKENEDPGSPTEGNNTIDSINARNASTSTTGTLIAKPRDSMDAMLSPRTAGRFASITSNDGRFNTKYNQSSDHQNTTLRTIFENIDHDFFKLVKNVEILHQILQTSVLNNNEFQNIPQILPRFFQVSFSGGSWTNPFSKFIYPSEPKSSNIALSSMSRENSKVSATESTRSSASALPTKMANAIALAAGINVPTGSADPSANNSSTHLENDMLWSSERNILNSVSLASMSSMGTRPSHLRTFTRSKRFNNKKKCPLNNDTLISMKKIANEIQEKFNVKESEEYLNTETKRAIRTLNLNSKTYEQINQNTTLIEILENLDLTIFINLKRLIKDPPKSIDHESEEFLKHAMASVSGIIGEFYDIKQSFHDILIRLIMSAQHTTLNDPYIFASMRPNHQIDSNEPILLEKILLNKQATKLERKSRKLMNHLIRQDVEFNNLDFLDLSEDFLVSCEKYIEITVLSCAIVEQLIEERENLLNYAARMMKNDLTTELLKGEQDTWFNYSSESDSDDSYTEAGEEDEDEDEDFVGEDEEDEVDEDDESSTNVMNKMKKQRTTIGNKKIRHNYNVEWYLQSEYDFDLIYDNKDQIKGGTKVALMEHLTSHEVIDPSFNVIMLISFRSIMPTKEFLYGLIYRYNLYPPEELNFDEYNTWIENKLNPIKCRVINIMKTFLQQYWTPYYLEPGLSSLEEFARLAINEGIPGAEELLIKIKENLISDPVDTSKENSNDDNNNNNDTNNNNGHNNNGHNNHNNHNKTKGSNGLKPEDIDIYEDENGSNKRGGASSLANSFFNGPAALIRLKKLKLLNIDPYVFASQLTILEHELYLRISMFECLDRAWGNKYGNMGGSINISKFIMNANSLTNYVSYSIVKQHDVKKRSRYIQFFIMVAQHCKELNNYSSMTAIVSALYSSPIYRLKKTWKTIPRNFTKILSALNNLMDSKRNFYNYRAQLRGMKDVACVPFFGVYLSDLTFTIAGNSDYLHKNKDIINFGKRTKIVDIIEEILSFKRVHYKLKRFDDIQTMIETSLEEVPHIEIQYQLSLEIEPRTNNTSSGTNPLDER
ncbi:hypothetical protein C6P44_002272 [Monosporozyma unispora]|nr:hypothetical protein C6P44_002272 [Kazachstania unispora]